MSTSNQIHLLKQYTRHEDAIGLLMESMMTSLDTRQLLCDAEAQHKAVCQLAQSYPFVELIYSLDPDGIQRRDSAYSPNVSAKRNRALGRGSDRSRRPYFTAARDSRNRVVVTPPYLSSATHELAISAVVHLFSESDEDLGYLIINFNLQRLIAYLNGDIRRSRFHPFFQGMYGVFGGLLVLVSMVLLYSAGSSVMGVFDGEGGLVASAFGTVVMLTLGMSIFDLGKTILEEEVLVDKDIHHHDTTRRTISRFMAAIIIAVSIEALLLIFKSLIKEQVVQAELIDAVWMLLASVAMLVGLGIYLKFSREEEQDHRTS